MSASPLPPEWAPHRATWLGYPSHPDLWGPELDRAASEVAALARALAGPGGERVKLFASGPEAAARARGDLGDVAGVEIVTGRFGDIWLRDTAPIFDASSKRRAHAFRWNGWGGKYVLDHDDEVAAQIAAESGVELVQHDFVLEGGAVDHDGLGTILTTRQCVLNPNRNPGWDETRAETALRGALGGQRVLWLDEGLENDHTDGHVDNIARFLAPGLVACPSPTGSDDPNAEVYEAIARALSEMTDARGSPLSVVRVPSPGRVTDAEGEIVPASHMNFVIANHAIVVPTYGEAAGAAAISALTAHAGRRAVIALPASAILTGGGSFHCITQQEPA